MSSVFAAATTNSGTSSLLIYAFLVLLVGYMFITQLPRKKAIQSLHATLEVGDEISTTSGLLGRITTLDDRIATIEVSPGVNVRFDRRAIAGPAPAASESSTPASSTITSSTITSSTSETDTPSDPTSPTD